MREQKEKEIQEAREKRQKVLSAKGQRKVSNDKVVGYKVNKD